MAGKAIAANGAATASETLRAVKEETLALATAIESGDLKSIRQIHESGYRHCESTSYTFLAAYTGQLGALQLLHTLGYSWDKAACMGAFEWGRLEVLRYLYEEQAPYVVHSDGVHKNCEDFATTIGLLWAKKIYAARAGTNRQRAPNATHRHTCRFCRLPIRCVYLEPRAGPHMTVPRMAARRTTCTAAALAGDLPALQNCRAHFDYWDHKTCASAAKGGHLKVLQWARANGCPWDREVCESAALGGHREVLEWAHANGCPWDHKTCASAALGGHLEVLKWARINGCPWSKWTCAYAAKGGHLEVLKWARANGCAWSKWTCAQAAGGGHLEVLLWARAHGCDWDEYTCAYAAKEGRLEIIQRAYADGCRPGPRTCEFAAKWGQLEVLEWLYITMQPYIARRGRIHPDCQSFMKLWGPHWAKHKYLLSVHSCGLKPAKP